MNFDPDLLAAFRLLPDRQPDLRRRLLSHVHRCLHKAGYRKIEIGVSDDAEYLSYRMRLPRNQLVGDEQAYARLLEVLCAAGFRITQSELNMERNENVIDGYIATRPTEESAEEFAPEQGAAADNGEEAVMPV